MKKALTIFICLLSVVTTLLLGQSRPLRDRWVMLGSSLDSDQEVERIVGMARTASEHGLNGILFSGGFDTMDLKTPEFFERLTRLKQACDKLGVELIPSGFGVGYGGGVLAHDKNLAAGQPVRGALFVVKGNEATFQADPAVKIANADFEKREGNLPAGFTAHGSAAGHARYHGRSFRQVLRAL